MLMAKAEEGKVCVCNLASGAGALAHYAISIASSNHQHLSACY